MSQIDSLQSTFYFSPAGATSAKANNQKTNKTEKKSKFSSIIEKKAAEQQMISAGLPPEIAEMEYEEALIYLKDKADIASDLIKNQFSLESFTEYRESIGNLMKFIVHINYEVEMKQRRRPTRRFKTEKFYLIKIIDQKLDQLANDILVNHLENLEILAKVNEINGILIDLIT